MSKEKWKKCKSEKDYLISSWGRVFSLKTGKKLRPYLHKSRCNYYFRIELGGKKYFVHRLVADAFLKNDNNKPQVDHNDRNTLNNNVKNLSWITEKENKQHLADTDLLIFNGKKYRLNYEHSK